MKKFIALFIGLIFALGGCGNTQNNASNQESTADTTTNDTLNIVASTTMLSDLANQIGGEHVSVEGLMGPGVDPHGYQPTASDNTKLQEADVVLYNGLHLEGKMGDIYEKLEQTDKPVIAAEDATSEEQLLESDEEGMAHDPHIWFSVPIWKDVANHLTTELSAIDPDHAESYQENNAAYQKELDELDTYIKERVSEVPEGQRYLVTAHDAFNYFGNEYDFEVVGIQGVNTQTEAGTSDVSELADFIADHNIKAIFVESSVSDKNIQALQEAVAARDHQVEIGGELYSDSLGDSEHDTDTYLKMFKANIDTIVDALK